MYGRDVTLLTLTEEAMGRWKECFMELLNLTNPPFMVKAELEKELGVEGAQLCHQAAAGLLSIFLTKKVQVLKQQLQTITLPLPCLIVGIMFSL